jgi:hypothetical protein
MKTLLGLACLVGGILLTPSALDVLMNGGKGVVRYVAPAAIAWIAGIWLVASRPKSDT